MRRAGTAPFLLAAALIVIGIAWARGGEYDEFYSVFLIANHPRPDWPTTPTTIASLHALYHGHADFTAIAEALRRGDVHPPLYFWLLALWRHLAGTALFPLRLLSVALTIAALALIIRIAKRIGAPPRTAALITLLCYGFAYTGIVARDFALAQLLGLAGGLALLEADRRIDPRLAFAGGIALGAACFTNYLASFTTIAGLLWLLAANPRRPALWGAGALGAALFIPAGAWFFLAQQGTRPGQFHNFSLPHAMADLARDQAGAILGALPRYVPHQAALPLEAALAAILLVLAALIARNGLTRLAPRHRALILAQLLAPPLGLLALGAAFDNMPIEVRYVWLGLPWFALAAATGLRDHKPALALLLTIQIAAILGLAIAPATMQPATRTARAAAAADRPNTLVLIPFGNDGVGIPGPFIAAAPPSMKILIVRHATADTLTASAAYRRIIIADIMVDTSSRRLIPRLNALFATSCWQRETSPAAITILANRCLRPKAPPVRSAHA